MEPINAHGVTLSQAIQDARREGVDLAGVSPPRDPWVKVGTTTIDGDRLTVMNMFGEHGIKWAAFRSGCVVEVDGRHLMAPGNGHGQVFDWNADTVMVPCDIVRRQSEIDAERRAAAADDECSSCGVVTHLSTHGTCSRCCDRAESPCPECGPHGNVGRVLLLESWVDCRACGSTQRHDPVISEEYPSLTSKVLQGADSGIAQSGVQNLTNALTPNPHDIIGTITEATTANLREHMAQKAKVGIGFSFPTVDEWMAYVHGQQVARGSVP